MGNGTGAVSERMCEVISDVYDFGWGVVTLAVLFNVVRVVHSHVRALEGEAGGASHSREGGAGPDPDIEQVGHGPGPVGLATA